MKLLLILSIREQIRKPIYSGFFLSLIMFGMFYSSSVFSEDLKVLQDCESCHTEQASEFQESVHYINRTGVQAGCNNCHAGQKHKNGKKTSKVVKKKRLDMAISEWKRFKANNSKECKTCHSAMNMDFAKQEPRSVERHEDSFNKGKTSCIQCHKGISHHLPSGWKAIAKKLDLH